VTGAAFFFLLCRVCRIVVASRIAAKVIGTYRKYSYSSVSAGPRFAARVGEPASFPTLLNHATPRDGDVAPSRRSPFVV